MATEHLFVIDGRHRLWAANLLKVPELRVDVHHPGGFGLRVVPTKNLELDPDVQFEDTFKPTHAKRIAREWDPEKVGVLLAVTEDLDPARKADLKKGRDDDRRNVGTIERFRIRVLKGDPVASEVNLIANRHHWEISSGRRAKAGLAIAAVTVLERIYRQLGAEGLDRVLSLADNWHGDPGASQAAWIGALGLLVRDGYDEAMTEQHYTRLLALAPAVVVRRAMGAASVVTGSALTGGDTQAGAVAYEAAAIVRRALKLRKRPAGSSAANVRPIA